MGINAMKAVLDQHEQKILALEKEIAVLKLALFEVVIVEKKTIEKKPVKHDKP